MKTLRILGLILAANVISVALCACGDDDESTSIPVDPKAKHITRYYYKGGNNDFYEIILSYDSQGRVTHMNVQYDLSHNKNYSFTYGDNTITVYSTGLNINSSTYIFTLTNGRITNLRRKETITSYSYDEQGYLKTRNGEKDYTTFTWEGGYLTSVEAGLINSVYKYEYEYSNYRVPANFIPFYFFTDDLMMVLAMQGFFGKLPPYLVSNMTSYDSDKKPSTTSYSYEMQEGRPVKINSNIIIDWE